MLVFVIMGIAFVIAVVYEIVTSMFLNTCDRYIEHTYNKENRSKLGWWIYKQYNPEYIESLKNGKAY